MTLPVSLAPLLERFFTQRLMQQRQASPHTISSYRDTFRHFLKFVQRRLQKSPARLTFEELDAPLIVAFLDDLERHGLSIRSRNLRLTAFHSFFRYAAFELPTHAAQIQRVLDLRGMRRQLEGRVAKERMERRQAKIPTADTEAVPFQIVEKRHDQRGVKFLEGQPRGRLLETPLHELQKVPEGVPIGTDGVGTGLALLHQALGKEALQERRQADRQRHG